MPLHPSSARKRQTQDLKRRIQNLTRYEPNSLSSDDERDFNQANLKGSVKKQGFLGVSGNDSRHAQAVLAHATETSVLQETGKYKCADIVMRFINIGGGI